VVSAGQQVLMAGAGFLAGICGAVAGLASLVSYPALLAAGLDPLVANVTNTVSLVLAGVGSAAASRAELRGQAGRVRRLLVLAATVIAAAADSGLRQLHSPSLDSDGIAVARPAGLSGRKRVTLNRI
jgi:hypothetical protein